MANRQTAREVALLVLTACEQQGAWSDGFLKKSIREAELDSRDAGLATQLCFGVLQNRMRLDYYLSHFSNVPLEKLEPKIRNILRLGADQLLLLDRVPDCAAVNESVNLARKYAKNPRASGMVNAILRNLVRKRDSLAEPEDLVTRYSHPDWLVKEFSLALKGEGVEALLDADNSQPPTMAQVNTLRFKTDQVRSALCEEGVGVQVHPWLPDCLLLTGTGDLERLKSFQDGAFYIQDGAAKLSVLAAKPKPGMRVLDACAAPGGKSFAAAIEMKNEGEIYACDIHPHKERLIRSGADRLGIDIIHTAIQDGKTFDQKWAEYFDLVIADVPCSGLGIIRKKPDIRYKEPGPLEGLPSIQISILNNVSAYVRPGGVLLYSTCTLLKRENEAVIDAFLERSPDFTLEAFQLPGPIGQVTDGRITLWPHLHGTDGFYFAKLRRRA